jgi:lysozyme family protein
MSAANYDESLERLLVHEGGYSNHPSDPGGPTNFGITIHDYRKYVNPSATAADVRSMPIEAAKRIYREKYWNVQRCDELAGGVDYAVFDYGVNSGVGRSGKVLRRLLGLPDDTGAVTDVVIAAVRRRDARQLVAAICDERLAFLQRLSTWPVLGNGWGRRVREVRAAALTMADGGAPVTASKPAGNDLASRIIAAMEAKGYRVDKGPGEVNIIYVEGMNPDGSVNDNKPNVFNDLRTVIRFENGQPKIVGAWEGTTEPGRRWTENPMNSGGAARIAFGQYRAWQLGMHHDHEALVQTGGQVTVCRDLNKDYSRAGDRLDTGWFGINQHWGYDLPKQDLGGSSAGCLVGRSKAGHRQFMAIVKSDPRFIRDDGFRFRAAVLPAADVVAAKVPVPGKGQQPPMSNAQKVGLGAGIVAALATGAHWLGEHWLITGGVLAVGLLVLIVCSGTRGASSGE